MVIRFIHTGDLHLGLQFTRVNFAPQIADERRMELWNTFHRIIDKGVEDGVDFLFIAGDLFEEKYFTLGDIKRVRDSLCQAKDINIIIVAGNHDTLNANSLYRLIEWPENVTIFDIGGIKKKDFPQYQASIYGYSWDKGEDRRDILDGFPEIDQGKINILLLHGDIYNRESKYLPLDKARLSGLGFDYIGLGHIHKPDMISDKMAYCGSPEPLHFGEQGDHGIIQGTIDKESIDIEFIPLSKRKFIEKTLVLEENLTYKHILDRVKTCQELREMDGNFYRINLRGRIDRYLAPYIHGISKDLEDYFHYLEIRDNTILDYDLGALEKENEDNIIGLFIKEMRAKDLDDRVNKEALYIGLEVLMKGSGLI